MAVAVVYSRALSGVDALPRQAASEVGSMPVRHPDPAEVKGQPQAKRALEIAASGRHSLLMIGALGTGKSMLAQRLPGILPPMHEAEALETAAIQSLTGAFRLEHWGHRPYRSPQSHGIGRGAGWRRRRSASR